MKNTGSSTVMFSTARGQMANTDAFDCDYYSWQDGSTEEKNQFNGEFLTEYSWGEYILGNMVHSDQYHTKNK